MIRTIGMWLAAMFTMLLVAKMNAGEIDAAQRNVIAEIEAEGADVQIGPAPDFAISIESDVFTENDRLFELLPKLQNLQSATLFPARHPRLSTLDAAYLAKLSQCPALESVRFESRQLEFADLSVLDALPKLKTLWIHCRTADALPAIQEYLQRPEAAKLESITLEVPQITDVDRAWIASLRNVRDIGLLGNGTRISNNGLEQLANKGNLRSIMLRRMEVDAEGMRALSRATGLESIEIGYPHFGDEALQMLAGLQRLKRLVIARSRITGDGMRLLGKMTSIEELDISSCPIGFGMLENLIPLRNLKHLNAADCGLEDQDLAALASVTSLESLDLSGNSKVSHEGLVHLAKLTKLTSLKLVGICNFPNGLNDFAPLKRLKLLHVNCDGIAASGIQALRGFTELEDLNLSTCNIGHGGLEAIKDLKSLRSLVLSGCELDDGDLAILRGLESLRKLHLNSNQLLTDEGIAHLSELKNLNDLWLTSKELSSDACLRLRTLSRMRSLDMRTNGYSEKALAALAGMPALRSLALRGPASLDESGLAALRQLNKMLDLVIELSEQSPVSARELADAFPQVRVRVNNQRFNVP